MNKYLNIARFASQDLKRNYALFFYNGFVLMLIAFLVGASVSFSASLSRETEQITKNMPQVWVQQLQGGRLVPLHDSVRQGVRQMRGIKAVWPRLWGFYADEMSNSVFCLMSLDSMSAAWPYLKLSNPAPQLLNDSSCVAGSGFLRSSGLDLGDFLSMGNQQKQKKNYQIVGKFDTEADILTHNILFLSQKSLRSLWQMPDSVYTDLGICMHNEAEADNLARKIAAQYPYLRVFTSEAIRSSYTAIWGWRGGVVIYGVIPALLCFLVLAWARLSGSSKSDYFGAALLKGLGWTIREVIGLKLMQHGYVGLLAVGTGLLMAYLHNTWLDAVFLRPLLVGRSQIYPDFSVYFDMSIGDVLTVLCFTLVPYLAISLVPIWRLAVVPPAEALR